LFPWDYPKQKSETPREILLRRLREGVPKELALRASGVQWDEIKDDPATDMALAEGEILLFERARDSGVTGIVRAAMRHETNTWTPKAEPGSSDTIEDLLRD
jgi:hypothetical protein